MSSLNNKRILVTGATGFIGGRIVERLVLEQGAEVVALVHQFKNASRLARFPIRMVGGDVCDLSSLQSAAKGCNAIIHAAMSMGGSSEDNRRANVEGTRNVCEVAKTNQARLVHFSTVSVYGNSANALLTEESPQNPHGDDYGMLKLDAERVVQQYQKEGLPATILQPTIVYGPWSFWSNYALNLLKTDFLALPLDGKGICNAVYIDDVCDAVFLAICREDCAPGPFLVSAPAPTTWRKYFEAHLPPESMGKVCAMSDEELAEFRTAHATSSLRPPILPPKWKEHLKGSITEIPGFKKFYNSRNGPKSLYRRLRGRPAIKTSPSVSSEQANGNVAQHKIFPSISQLPLLESETAVDIQKAKKVLGYSPKFDIETGGILTRQWAQWANF